MSKPEEVALLSHHELVAAVCALQDQLAAERAMVKELMRRIDGSVTIMPGDAGAFRKHETK